MVKILSNKWIRRTWASSNWYQLHAEFLQAALTASNLAWSQRRHEVTFLQLLKHCLPPAQLLHKCRQLALMLVCINFWTLCEMAGC